MVLLFFDFGSGEIMLIILAIFLIFGPDKIPGLARSMGKFINEIKHATDDIKKEINIEADRQEREKKLEKYNAQIKADLAPEKTEKREAVSTQENTQPENKEEIHKPENKADTQ
ncbi:MAG TPA: twin-arginine translocase TatA/TatE family subunit [Bacteroidales bacterium]